MVFRFKLVLHWDHFRTLPLSSLEWNERHISNKPLNLARKEWFHCTDLTFSSQHNRKGMLAHLLTSAAYSIVNLLEVSLATPDEAQTITWISWFPLRYFGGTSHIWIFVWLPIFLGLFFISSRNPIVSKLIRWSKNDRLILSKVSLPALPLCASKYTWKILFVFFFRIKNHWPGKNEVYSSYRRCHQWDRQRSHRQLDWDHP